MPIGYAFTGGSDGDTPNPGLVMDSSGAIYGTTQFGGTALQGVAFRLTPPRPGETQWRETVIHTFSYSVVFDLGFNFLLQRYQAIQVRPAIRVGEYLSFAAKLVLALGVAFDAASVLTKYSKPPLARKLLAPGGVVAG